MVRSVSKTLIGVLIASTTFGLTACAQGPAQSNKDKAIAVISSIETGDQARVRA